MEIEGVPGMTSEVKVTVVIPALNEAENIVALLEGIDAAMAGRSDYEIVVVDDGSTDDTGALVLAGPPHWRVLRHSQKAGQSAAVHSGVTAARGDVIVTLDGDGQNPPEFIPAVLTPLEGDAAGSPALVAGQRAKRQDTFSKRWASKAANAIRSRLLKDETRDTGCGLKAFRRDAFLELPFFNHMHRYLPALFARAGYSVHHVDVGHAPRVAGTSKYNNLQRALVGAVDLLGVYWLIKRRKIATAQERVREDKNP